MIGVLHHVKPLLLEMQLKFLTVLEEASQICGKDGFSDEVEHLKKLQKEVFSHQIATHKNFA